MWTRKAMICAPREPVKVGAMFGIETAEDWGTARLGAPLTQNSPRKMRRSAAGCSIILAR